MLNRRPSQGSGARIGGQRRFPDRAAAGERLAEALVGRVRRPALVLGIPRGGVIVAATVARRLGAPLDVVVPRKVGAPGNPELAVGAVAEGVEVIDHRALYRLGFDAGVATGWTVVAAARWCRRNRAERVVVAVPVGPPDLEHRLGAEVDDVVVLERPEPYLAVGQAYIRFDQVSDEQVLACLRAVDTPESGEGPPG